MFRHASYMGKQQRFSDDCYYGDLSSSGRVTRCDQMEWHPWERVGCKTLRLMIIRKQMPNNLKMIKRQT